MSDWKKGGLRYLKLKRIVPAYLSPAQVLAFFVAVEGPRSALQIFSPLSPLRREYVIAATTEGLVVLRLRRPGVFRASIADTVVRASPHEVDPSWNARCLSIDGVNYRPIPFHQGDAEKVANLYKGWTRQHR